MTDGVVKHDGDCPPCQKGRHRECLEDPEVGNNCECADGGHL